MIPRPRDLDFVAKFYSNLAVVLLIPVSITIVLVVWAVQVLSPIYAGRDQSPLYLAVSEGSASTPAEKFGSSLLNALVVVAMVTGITILLVVLYKFGCVKIIIGWLVVSAGLVFFFLCWVWLDLLCTRYQIPYDYLGMAIFLWNFGIVGILSIFYRAHPKMGQAYLVVLSIIMGWMLTRLPEWSTWTILVAVAIYDIVAVLCPKGPLQMLVRLAQERNQPIPGFVYDSSNENQLHPTAAQPPQTAPAAAAAATPASAAVAPGGSTPSSNPIDGVFVPIAPVRRNSGGAAASSSTQTTASAIETQRQQPPPVPSDPSGPPPPVEDEEEEEEEIDPFASAGDQNAFKLGLGDFIFYSLLVGRASMFSYSAWMACFICVLVGLVGTLTSLLFLRGKVPALPALPISIFTGVAAFFLTRFLSEPYSLFLATSGYIV